MILRAATIEDLDQITAIYNDAVSLSLVTFDIIPKDRDAQLEWLSSHSGIYPAIVAVDDVVDTTANVAVGDMADGSTSMYADEQPWNRRPEHRQPLHERSILGFGSLSPYRDRAAYRTTVESSIYVHAGNRRSGTGKAIMEALLDHARTSGFHAVIARISTGNHPSIALHGSLGFEEIGLEREVGRKFGKWLDVLVMERLL
ncbi:MAG: N-acetyltransferase family protein [Actinobacteria bacterium]|nr:N-acetyltransferase family protein [Actinomycetota bacterium]MCL5446468.1 N-acetyltransferase family protein [Actinomycetota bacterium]